MRHLVMLAVTWSAYFALHSALAANPAKAWVSRRWPAAASRYRLFYNILATVLAVPLLYWTLRLPAVPLWQWQGGWAVIGDGLALVSVVGIVWTSRYYDMRAFLGTRGTAAGPPAEDREPFTLSPVHRFVRHPWYFFGLLILWTRDMHDTTLTAIACATIYLVIGSRLEDRKLVREYGDAYARYMRRVPGLLPSPFRHLSRQEAADPDSIGDR